MRTFEQGKRYGENAVIFEIIKRTAKTVTYVAVQHAGKPNERLGEAQKAKLYNWGDREVFHTGNQTVEA